jgi:hypothetical protein
MESAFQLAARKRWPGYTVTGAGSIAVVRQCQYSVVLASTPLEAQAIASERCGQHCSHMLAPEGGWHTIKMLETPKQHTPPVWKSPAELDWRNE